MLLISQIGEKNITCVLYGVSFVLFSIFHFVLMININHTQHCFDGALFGPLRIDKQVHDYAFCIFFISDIRL